MRRVAVPAAIALAAAVSLLPGGTAGTGRATTAPMTPAARVLHHRAGGQAAVSAVRRVIALDGRSRKRRAWATGRGFDTCAAPPLRAMAAWRKAYGIVNVNIGGVARGCAQPNLTRDWIRAVRQMGYRLIPTYVGLQAPCNKRFHHRFTAKRAATEGRRAADDAVRRARALGIRRHAPIYYDIEAYDSRKAWCRDAVLRFLHEWTRRLHRHHYRSGVYSSVASGIRDLGWTEGIAKPNAIWFAHWDGAAKVHGSPYIPDEWWARHRRIKQFRGGHKEKHGGVTIYVDSNIVDGPVY